MVLSGRTDRDKQGVTNRREIRGGSKVDRDLRPMERQMRPKDDMSAPASAACPRCGAFARMLPIAFGYPMPETFAAAERGEVALGGCLVSGEDPTHHCTSCDQDVILDRAGEPTTTDTGATCVSCGAVLGDPDEEQGITAASSFCGECARARNFDELLWEIDAADDDQ
jgi:hypothetical protein